MTSIVTRESERASPRERGGAVRAHLDVNRHDLRRVDPPAVRRAAGGGAGGFREHVLAFPPSEDSYQATESILTQKAKVKARVQVQLLRD